MEKILLIIFMSLFALPVFAVCSITGGACAAPINNFESQSLEDKFVPNHLHQIQKTDAFQNDIHQPINSEFNTNQSNSETNDYNSNCQFGICLPGSNKFENKSD